MYTRKALLVRKPRKKILNFLNDKSFLFELKIR